MYWSSQTESKLTAEKDFKLRRPVGRPPRASCVIACPAALRTLRRGWLPARPRLVSCVRNEEIATTTSKDRPLCCLTLFTDDQRRSRDKNHARGHPINYRAPPAIEPAVSFA